MTASDSLAGEKCSHLQVVWRVAGPTGMHGHVCPCVLRHAHGSGAHLARGSATFLGSSFVHSEGDLRGGALNASESWEGQGVLGVQLPHPQGSDTHGRPQMSISGLSSDAVWH